ncbi:MAG: hypothetical protein CM1200mP28_04960 [Deltaproteobacteria bacterium]|nr:MAG: hypothetical protein CM1200mP28_04960 [Deltaproteobacteria bacterium]
MVKLFPELLFSLIISVTGTGGEVDWSAVVSKAAVLASTGGGFSLTGLIGTSACTGGGLCG